MQTKGSDSSHYKLTGNGSNCRAMIALAASPGGARYLFAHAHYKFCAHMSTVIRVFVFIRKFLMKN